MKLHEEFSLYENMWEQPLREDNMADMRRSIRAEIAELEAEKAADTDPTSAVYYDEKIAACKAELSHLSNIAPTKATAKKRELAAQREAAAKRIESRLRYLGFLGLRTIFDRPKIVAEFLCEASLALRHLGEA